MVRHSLNVLLFQAEKWNRLTFVARGSICFLPSIPSSWVIDLIDEFNYYCCLQLFKSIKMCTKYNLDPCSSLTSIEQLPWVSTVDISLKRCSGSLLWTSLSLGHKIRYCLSLIHSPTSVRDAVFLQLRAFYRCSFNLYVALSFSFRFRSLSLTLSLSLFLSLLGTTSWISCFPGRACFYKKPQVFSK